MKARLKGARIRGILRNQDFRVKEDFEDLRKVIMEIRIKKVGSKGLVVRGPRKQQFRSVD